MWRVVIFPRNYAAALLGLAFALNAAQALGDAFFINPSIHYRSGKEVIEFSGGQREVPYRSSLVNVSAGYSLGSGLLLGIKYFGERHSTEILATSGGEGTPLIDLQTSAIGAGIGFLVEGISFNLSVLAIKAPKKTDQVREVELEGGTGTLLDIAYFAQFGDLYLGPQISWRSFEFKEYRYGGTDNDPLGENFVSLKEQHIEPYLSLLYFL